MNNQAQHHSKYTAKVPDAQGIIHYTAEEHAVWKTLISRQEKIVTSRACDEYLKGLKILDFSHDQIPQPSEVSEKLKTVTGWSVEPVPALISYDRFFELLANRQFPAASFIRVPEELDYLQEPDIFHEYYGHCPMLTHQLYADFMHAYGKIGIKASAEDQVLLARLYWFTIEFGLIETNHGIRCYGGGILSSIAETVYALESNVPKRKPFEPLNALRTPYRIDIKQPIYFVIKDFQELYNILEIDLFALMQESRRLGEFPLSYPEESDQHWVTC